MNESSTHGSNRKLISDQTLESRKIIIEIEDNDTSADIQKTQPADDSVDINDGRVSRISE